ncbi:MAG: glycoside hydrolase family 76 protein [Petrimonas sp.]|nr:glycoside hydrolase family 76 protein [Petrimonas sp.]
MKKRFYYFLVPFIVSAVLLSCSHDDEVNNTIEIKAVERLISPTDNSVLTLTNNPHSMEKFEWQRADASKGVTPKYEIIFFKENSTSAEPIFTFSTTSNSINVNHIRLDEIAAKADIEPGSSGTIKWTVRAYYDSVSAMSQQVGRIVIKRPDVETPVTALFLTGKGTEFGENIAEAMEFTKITDTEFVIFSELTAGLPFRFISDTEGDKIRSFSLKGNKLVEEDTNSEVAKSGVYKITVNLSSASASLREVTDISLYYCIKHRAINLQYQGRGIWSTVCLINFSQEAWGDETRYKFRMTEEGQNKFLERATDSPFPMKESIITNHDRQLWDGVWTYAANLKDKWAEVIVDMSKYTHTIKVVREDFSAVGGSWADMADRSTLDFVRGFWNNNAKHFNNSVTGTINRYDYWPEAHALDVIIDAYLRSNDSKYYQIIYDFYEGVKRKNGNTFKNSFYDDMAWHGLAHLRAFEATSDARYETSARDLWKWVLEGWDDNGGGIKWNDQPGSVPGVPSTGPATIIGVRRWVKYGDTEKIGGINNLEWAKRMYEWMREARHDPVTGGVYDDLDNKSGAWNYNAGTFLGSAMELYDVTGEQRYLTDAIRTADWTLENLSVPTETNRILSDWAEQEDHDVNLFKGIFIRYFTRLIMHPDLPADKKDKYIEFIEYNAKAMMTYASATNDGNILLYNYAWYFKPKDSFLRAQISGCTLIEAMALLEKEGFL